ncbi:hypothetical protein Lfu02_59260 [Longispora fulva]|uniref:Uncharacterized protein n=1 Tax=Longispora fulva TaxID=619741 RepID=A0A8J7GI58_9ACTN|nr:hypothetical protein [Longispora fulva]MBG6137092.1 hypothetical protein [Longispora fulva]GIG61554.1 hypothetical protein Lfu02_59260 [Longispora fulva]
MKPIRLFTVGAVLAIGAAVVPVTMAAATSKAPAVACSVATHGPHHDEAGPACVAAEVTLDRLPAVGESATVKIRLRSQVSIDAARLSVRLPRSLRLDTAGTGLSAPRAVGLDQAAEQTFALSTGGRTVTLRVTALEAGPAQVQADVTDAGVPDQSRSAHGSTVFTVGERAGGSHAGLAGTDSPAVDAGVVRPAANGRTTPLTAAAPRSTAAGQICATGQFTVADKTGTWLAGRNIPVAVLGRTTSSAATQTYATGLTGATDGRYSVCFTSPVTTMYSVQVKFTSDSSVWRVTDNAGANTYSVTTAARTNVQAGTVDFGTTSPTSTYMRGWHAFDTLNLLWGIRASGTNCWTARETANCTKITLHWQPGSTDGTYFDPDGRYVAMEDADPDSEHLVLHESGHHFMDLLYNRWWPVFDCPDPHYLQKRSGPTCAWTEGFANAIAGYAKGDGMFYWPDGESVDLMTTAPFDPRQPASHTNIEDGDQVECRVAGSIIDLWRRTDNGPAATFDLMRRYQSSTFREWFNDDRPLTGLDTSATARDLVYTHTIDYRTGTPGSGVANGGFESGTANWTITGGVVGNWPDYPAQQGSWYAWMGGNGVVNTDTLSQQITIPSTATSATLGYYLRIATQESGSTAYDTFKVQVIDGSTTTTLATFSNTNASNGYVARTVSLSAFRGRTVTLRFVSTEDSSLTTDFLLDSVTLTTT